MVHALREAHRVLRPGGILVDLRPEPRHRRVGLGTGGRWRHVAVMNESLEEDRAANRAVARILRERLFRREARGVFPLERVMDTMTDLHAWLSEFQHLRGVGCRDGLVRRVERALAGRRTRPPIVGRGRMMLGLLRRVD